MAHRPVASMVLVRILCAALFEGFNSLIPVYVREVLHEDPANSIYIFAPAGIGYLIGAVGGPWLIHWFGERKLAIISLDLHDGRRLSARFDRRRRAVLCPLQPAAAAGTVSTSN